MSDFLVSPVQGSYRYGSTHSDPISIQYVAKSERDSLVFQFHKVGHKDYTLITLIPRVGKTPKYVEKHYTTWDRAYKGLLAISNHFFCVNA